MYIWFRTGAYRSNGRIANSRANRSTVHRRATSSKYAFSSRYCRRSIRTEA
jgi:hypothetical protein